MTGPDIEAALNDMTAWYLPLGPGSARQYFNKNGETPYLDDSGKTYGEWMVKGDKYCSVWPPSDRVSCYAVERSTAADGREIIVFVSGGGTRYEAATKPGKHIDEAWEP